MDWQLGQYFIDVAIWIDGQAIAIEYDGWYWHKDNLERDANRDQYCFEQGWRVLRIKSNALIPSEDVLWEAIEELVSGDLLYAEIAMEDWGD